MEIFRIWNTQTAHAMLMSPLFKMPLKRPSTPVAVVPTYLAFELLQISKINHSGIQLLIIIIITQTMINNPCVKENGFYI